MLSGFMLMMLLVTACRSESAFASHTAALRVTRVDASRYEGNRGGTLEEACTNWRLSPVQVARFFRLSQHYQEDPYNAFYQLPCSISGELEAEGKVWRFQINGGATATWTSGEDERHWGCSAKACESLVLLPTDGMNPDGE